MKRIGRSGGSCMWPTERAEYHAKRGGDLELGE